MRITIPNDWGIPMKKLLTNERGLSLVEVIASIVLISIIITAFLTIFPQMKKSNESTGEHLDAANIAKELLVIMKAQSFKELEKKETIENLNYSVSSTSDSLILDGQYSYIEGKKVDVRIEIKDEFAIKNEEKPEEGKLRQMTIEILNENDNVIARIHGYLQD